jgi:hypothetical protein
MSEEEYWQKLIEAGAQINAEPGPYSTVSRNSHSALNSMKNYANSASSPYRPTSPILGFSYLTPASGVNVLQGAGTLSTGSVRPGSSFGLQANSQITANNVRAFINFIAQFLN